MLRVPPPARITIWRIAVRLGLMAALSAGPAFAADTGNGSKNFHTPNTVPNYFSNEAGPIAGGAAETQRGPLYPSQTASLPRQEQAVAPPAYRAETRRIVVGHGRGHVVSRADRRHAASRGDRRHVASRGERHAAAPARSRSHVATRGGPPSHSTHAASRPTHVGSTHRGLRG